MDDDLGGLVLLLGDDDLGGLVLNLEDGPATSVGVLLPGDGVRGLPGPRSADDLESASKDAEASEDAEASVDAEAWYQIFALTMFLRTSSLPMT